MYRSLMTGMALLALAACGGESPPPTDAATTTPAETSATNSDMASAFAIEDAYIRMPLAGSDKTAAYFTLTSSADTMAFLIDASTPAAETAELHTHTHENGMMAMRKADLFEIPANGVLELRPMGNHLMLFGVDSTLADGDVVSLTLVISVDGEPVVKTIDVPVKPLG